MDWRGLLRSLQAKLTPDEQEYLAAHRLQDILFEETKLCDDPATARLICRKILHEQVLQAIQLTQKCPGVLTSVMYLSAYEYMTQNLLGMKFGDNGSKITERGVHALPRETGKPLVFTIRKGGEAAFFRDIDGAWYDWRCKKEPKRSTVTGIGPTLYTTPKESNLKCLSLKTAEDCFINQIQNYEDWVVFRRARCAANMKACARRSTVQKSGAFTLFQTLAAELTEEDKALIDSLYLDAHIEALYRANQHKPVKLRYSAYISGLKQLLSTAIWLSQRVPGALTTYITLYTVIKFNELEAKRGVPHGSAGFRACYRSTTSLARGQGRKLLFCLRDRGVPVLFFGEDRNWYSHTGLAVARLARSTLGYHFRRNGTVVFISKHTADLCYRYGHDEYTTWKEIKKGGGLDELD